MGCGVSEEEKQQMRDELRKEMDEKIDKRMQKLYDSFEEKCANILANATGESIQNSISSIKSECDKQKLLLSNEFESKREYLRQTDNIKELLEPKHEDRLYKLTVNKEYKFKTRGLLYFSCLLQKDKGNKGYLYLMIDGKKVLTSEPFLGSRGEFGEKGEEGYRWGCWPVQPNSTIQLRTKGTGTILFQEWS